MFYDTQEFMKKCGIVHQNFTTRLIAKGILQPVKREGTGKTNWYSDKDVIAFKNYVAGSPPIDPKKVADSKRMHQDIENLKMSLNELQECMETIAATVEKQSNHIDILKRVVTSLTTSKNA